MNDFTIESACRVCKDPSSTEAERIAAFDFLHPVVRKGDPRPEAPRSSEPPRQTISQPPPAAPSVTSAAPAPPAPAAPGPRLSPLRIILAFGAPVRFNSDEEGPCFQLATRLECSNFETEAEASAAAAPLREFCIVSIERLTKMELNQLTVSSRPAPPRGQRLVSMPPPAPRAAPVKYGEKFIVIADAAPVAFLSDLHNFRVEIVSRIRAWAFTGRDCAGYIPRIMGRGWAVDGRGDYLTDQEAAASRPKTKPVGLAGAINRPSGICIVLVNGEPVLFYGSLADGLPHEKCSRLEATQFPSCADAIRSMWVDNLKAQGVRVSYERLSPQEVAASRPRQPGPLMLLGLSKVWPEQVMTAGKRSVRRSDAFPATA